MVIVLGLVPADLDMINSSSSGLVNTFCEHSEAVFVNTSRLAETYCELFESTCGCNSAVECLLPKQDVEGSNPFTRSIKLGDDVPRLKNKVANKGSRAVKKAKPPADITYLE